MDEEDDYDFDDELEQALAEEDEGPKKPGLPSGPGLPTAPPATASESEHLPTASESEQPPPPVASIAQRQLSAEDEGRKKQAMLESMTEDQQNRHEACCRASLPRKSMRRLQLLQAVTGQTSSSASAQNVCIVLSGVAKMFAGELIEEARLVAAQQSNFGPLQPSHIHEAYQRLDAQGKLLHSAPPKRRRL